MSKKQDMPKTEMVKTSLLKTNPNNPRVIRDERFFKLVKSIKEFPEMLQIRPIVVDADMVVLGGNMRLKACIEAGMKEVPVLKAENLTKEQQDRFVIADNVNAGEWDFDALANEWEVKDLSDWGVDVPIFESENELDYSGKNKEINTDDFEDKCTIILSYTMEEYEQVKTALHKVAQTPEQAVWQLLNL